MIVFHLIMNLEDLWEDLEIACEEEDFDEAERIITEQVRLGFGATNEMRAYVAKFENAE